MADSASKDERQKHKKKHKKRSSDADESVKKANKGSSDNNGEEQSLENKDRVKTKSKHSIASEMAPKTDGGKHKWTDEERQLLVQQLKEYAALDKHTYTPYTRVDWNDIAVGDINKSDLNEEYKRLIKKVRKLRTVGEVLEDVTLTGTAAKDMTKNSEKPPKRPPNAFMLFCSAKRPSLTEKHPGLTFTEVHKKLCLKWRDTGDEKKGKYVKKAEKLKRLHMQQVESYREQKKLLVKKPQTAYQIWKLEKLEENDYSGEDQLIQEWEAMSAFSKKGWKHAALNDINRYNSELKLLGTPANPRKSSKKSSTETTTTTTTEHEESDSSDSIDKTPVAAKRKSILNTPSAVVKKAKAESSSAESSSSDE